MKKIPPHPVEVGPPTLSLLAVIAAGCTYGLQETERFEDEQLEPAEVATAQSPLAGGNEENIWSDYWFGGHSFANFTDPLDNQVLSLGYNVSPNSTVRDPTRPAWMMTFESWYEVCPGCDHLHEWHIQWRGTDGTPLRPLTVGVNPEQQKGSVSIFGRTTINDDDGLWQVSVGNGTIWSNGLAFVNDVNDSPVLMQRRADKNGQHGGWAEFARVNDADEVEIGRGASGVRFSAGNKPVVTSCSDLIVALDAMGLIVDATQ